MPGKFPDLEDEAGRSRRDERRHRQQLIREILSALSASKDDEAPVSLVLIGHLPDGRTSTLAINIARHQCDGYLEALEKLRVMIDGFQAEAPSSAQILRFPK